MGTPLPDSPRHNTRRDGVALTVLCFLSLEKAHPELETDFIKINVLLPKFEGDTVKRGVLFSFRVNAKFISALKVPFMKFVNKFIDGETGEKNAVGVRHLGRSGAGSSSPGMSAPQRVHSGNLTRPACSSRAGTHHHDQLDVADSSRTSRCHWRPIELNDSKPFVGNDEGRPRFAKSASYGIASQPGSPLRLTSGCRFRRKGVQKP